MFEAFRRCCLDPGYVRLATLALVGHDGWSYGKVEEQKVNGEYRGGDDDRANDDDNEGEKWGISRRRKRNQG
jgi:hypothetical protein